MLRGVGAFELADEANIAAYERSRTHGLPEPLAHALLDLADGRLRAGDPDGAAAHLATLGREVDEDFLFRWRTRLRTGLVSGRWSLAVGKPDEAVAAFEQVQAEASRLRLRRYLVLSRLWHALARHAAGERVGIGGLIADVDALPALAPLEAWWVTGEVARALGVAQWSTLATQRAQALAARAGPYGDRLRDRAGRFLSPDQ